MNSFSFAALTDVGTVRTNNEDAALASCSLLALADGMGGHAAGEVAAAVVTHSIARLLGSGAAITPDLLRESTRQARQALRAMSESDPEMEGMGTTLVALAAHDDGMVLAHVGDSRLYRVRDGVVTQVTTDHTHVQRLVDSGRLDPDAVRTHPYRSVILRSIDDTSDDLPDVGWTTEIEPGDRVLLCSDGLSDYVTPEVLETALRRGSPLDAARALLSGALRAGTRDNVTVVVADVHDAEDTLDPASPVEPPVTVGASLGHSDLSETAREVLVGHFPDAEVLVDTVPRPAALAAARELEAVAVAAEAVPVGGVPVSTAGALGDAAAPVPTPPAAPEGIAPPAEEADATAAADVDITLTAADLAARLEQEASAAEDDDTAVAGAGAGAGTSSGDGAPSSASPFAPESAAVGTSTVGAEPDAHPRADPHADTEPLAPPSQAFAPPTPALAADPGTSTPSEPLDTDNHPHHRRRATRLDVTWLSMVVASFTAVTLVVWLTAS